MSASIASCVVDTAEPTEHAVRGTADPLIVVDNQRSEEHTSELQSRPHIVCRLLLAKKRRVRSGPKATPPADAGSPAGPGPDAEGGPSAGPAAAAGLGAAGAGAGAGPGPSAEASPQA